MATDVFLSAVAPCQLIASALMLNTEHRIITQSILHTTDWARCRSFFWIFNVFI